MNGRLSQAEMAEHICQHVHAMQWQYGERSEACGNCDSAAVAARKQLDLALARTSPAGGREHVVSDTEECWCEPEHVRVEGKR